MGSYLPGGFGRVPLLVLLVGVGLSGQARAYTPGVITSEYAANLVINSATAADASWAATNSAGSARVGKNFVMKAPGGRTVAAEASKLLARGAVTKLALGALPYLAAGALAWDLWDAYRIHDAASFPGTPAGAGLVFDPGADPTTSQEYRWSGPGATQLATVDAACSALHNTISPYKVPGWALGPNWGDMSWSFVSGGGTVRSNNPNLADCKETKTTLNRAQNGSVITQTEVFASAYTTARTMQTVTGCPASVDPFNGAYSIPAGMPVDADGKCERARGLHTPITADEAAQIDAARLLPIPDLAALTAEALGKVPYPMLPETGIEVGNVVPSHLDGPTTTTTSVQNGATQTQTEAIGWDWSRDPLNPNKGKWNEVVSTITRDAAGNTINSTTTTTAGTTPGDKAEAGSDPCVADPGRLGCIGLGTPPTDAIPKTSRSIDFASVTVGVAGSCPAAVPMGNSGKSFSFTPLCDGLTQARPLIIAIGFFMAAGIVAAALRT